MTEVTLAQALGGVLAVPQFFIYRLRWNAAEGKYEKTPCYGDGRPLGKDEGGFAALWTPYDTAVANLAALRARDGHNAYTLGWWVTKDAGYWFLDADNVVREGGELSPEAAWFFQALPGAFCEWSSSGKGLHWVGRGLVPPHSSCPAVAKAAGLEFYTDGRGIAFGLTDKATGCADVDHTAVITTIAGHWFKPSEVVQHGSGPRPEWRGPTDDAELLRRALASSSVGGLLNGKASFADLWNANAEALAKTYPPDPGSDELYGASHADAALAMQLAFWTGCDADRIERLMLQSALKRDKWDKSNHATYLRELTITRACSGVSRVLQDEERVTQVTVTTTDDARAVSDAWQQRILKADEVELRNVVVGAIAADRSIDMLDRERLAGLLKTRFADFMINLSIGQCRKMLRSEKVVEELAEVGVPAFATEHVYVRQGDVFFHVPTATVLTRTAFQATYNRAMAPKANGDKEDAAKWCLERWNTQTVHDLMYHPRRDPIFTHNTQPYANLYAPGSVPEVEPFTPEGIQSIHAFARHLELFCGSRAEVYGGLLAWMAFNVQNPGRKIRFAPILKGVPGDGKSIITKVLRAAMGDSNVNEVGPSIVMNSGGFTDWAHGACVIALEEMMMQGKNRYAMANAIKENITNDRVTINRKGRGQLPIINISNFICFTNHSNAVPLEDNDRRWWVIFSPYASIADAAKAHGVDDLSDLFRTITRGAELYRGQLRRWLMEMAIPAWFDPDGHAPDTAEKGSMRDSGENEEHSIARQVIDAGAVGVTFEAISSSCLTAGMRSICIVEGVDLPQGSKVNSMLNDLSYQSLGTMKIGKKIHRVWVKPGVSRDRARMLIETSYLVSSTGIG